MQNITAAQSAADAGAAITKPASSHPPRTLNHALGRAALAGAEVIGSHDPLGNALGRYSVAMEKSEIIYLSNIFFSWRRTSCSR